MPDNEKNERLEEEEVVEETVEAHPSSGLAQQLSYYLPKEGDADYVPPAGEHKPEEKVVDGFTSEEMAELNELLESEEPDFSKYDEEKLNKIKEVFPEKFEVSVEEDSESEVDFSKMDAPTLIEEVKKNQRLVSERNTKIKELEDKLKTTPKGEDIPETEYQKFVKEARVDLSSAWKKFKDKFDLPDVSLVSSVNANSIDDRLLQWQQTELRDTIEKEFGLEKGEFEVVKEDLFTPKTPSYRWRTLTQSKETELQNEMLTNLNNQKKQLDEVRVQQQADIDWYAETYLGGDKEAAKTAVIELNNIPARIEKGELKPDAHPFSLKNLLRGANHETLTKMAVDEAVKNLTKAFNEKGIYLETKDFPTDITMPKGKSPEGDGKTVFSKEELEKSPMLRSLMGNL